MAENLTPKKYIDSSNMKQILAAIKSKTPVGDEYVTEEQLLAKDYATKTYVGEQIVNAEHLKREIVTVLPSDEEASDNVIYMLKVESATGNDKYQEYMKIDGTVQMIGDTSVDLTDYAKTSDIPTTVAELTDSSSYAKKTDIPTTLPANGGNADTVNNHTVKSDVPENAVFTDTIYDDTELNAKLNGKADKNAVLNSLEIVNSYTTAQIIPWSDGTHYRSFEDKSNNTYTDIVTNNGIALIARTENGVMTKSEEIATMDKLKFVPSTILNSGFKVVAYSDREITGNSKLECLENWITNALSKYINNSCIIGNIYNNTYVDGFAIVNVCGSNTEGIIGASGLIVDQEGIHYYRKLNGTIGSGTLTRII